MDRALVTASSGRLLRELRDARPLVQAITNFVSMDAVANALLSLGAAPAMIHAPEESAEFIAHASALVVNIGTLSNLWLEGGEAAATAARMHGKPWVLDPVGVGGTRFRNEAVARLLRHRPSVIRGNASEIMAVAQVAGLAGAGGVPRGVDSANTTDEALVAAQRLARHCFCTVAATGSIDVVTDGQQTVRLANGHPLMTRVTALGCALSAVVGAFAAVSPSPFEATVAAVAIYGVVGEITAERASRPGSYRVAFMDALDEVSAADIDARLKILS